MVVVSPTATRPCVKLRILLVLDFGIKNSRRRMLPDGLAALLHGWKNTFSCSSQSSGIVSRRRTEFNVCG